MWDPAKVHACAHLLLEQAGVVVRVDGLSAARWESDIVVYVHAPWIGEKSDTASSFFFKRTEAHLGSQGASPFQQKKMRVLLWRWP